MNTIEYNTVDKTSWNEGPWLHEPDKVQWPDEETGLPCLAVRNPLMGHWCGYVGVAPDHLYYNQDYDNLPSIAIHGGLTYAASCQGGEKCKSICHIPAEDESDDIWWLGFDCAHAGDVSPAADARMGILGYGEYRTLEYVQNQCKSLAQQLVEAKP